MKIVVLAGGFSPERDVSFSSGAKVANALMEKGYTVMLVDLYLGGKNIDFPLVYHTKEENFSYASLISKDEPNLEELKKLKQDGNLIAEEVLEECKKADKVFLALHGDIGENGKLQSFLDIYEISYTGSSALGCMLSMDKNISKQLFTFHHILTPKWKYLTDTTDISDVTYPCVLKPCSNGSSIGIVMISHKEELISILASKKNQNFLLEERIIGREFSVGILNGEALPVIEIIPKHGFYDYENKYQEGATKEVCPANLREEKAKEIQSIACKVHQILHLGYYSRVDFMMDESGTFYVLEANSLPGMTPMSLLPQAALVQGISYVDLCEMILQLD